MKISFETFGVPRRQGEPPQLAMCVQHPLQMVEIESKQPMCYFTVALAVGMIPGAVIFIQF